MQLDKSFLILFGMLAGFVSIVLGYKLFLKGIEGSATLEGEIKKVKLTLRNASPGLFFALFGAFIIISGIYKPEINSIKISQNGTSLDSYSSKSEIAPRTSHEISTSTKQEIFQSALEYRKKGLNDYAKLLYFLLLQADNTNHVVHNNLAYIYLSENNFEAATLHAKSAIELSAQKEQQAAYYDTLARIYFKKNGLNEAYSAIQKAVNLDSKNTAYRPFSDEIKRRIVQQKNRGDRE